MDNSFDFFVGEWTSVQRRLRTVLAGSDDWYEIEGVTRCWRILDGAGNADEVTFPKEGWRGFTLRLYDPATELWSLYWATARAGLSLPPVVGRFDAAGVGRFTCPDVYQGTPVTVLYEWSDITPESARWAQRFSIDGGATWETNWTAAFTRTG
jgi:hypothetical protein